MSLFNKKKGLLTEVCFLKNEESIHEFRKCYSKLEEKLDYEEKIFRKKQIYHQKNFIECLDEADDGNMFSEEA